MAFYLALVSKKIQKIFLRIVKNNIPINKCGILYRIMVAVLCSSGKKIHDIQYVVESFLYKNII